MQLLRNQLLIAALKASNNQEGKKVIDMAQRLDNAYQEDDQTFWLLVSK